MSEMLSADSLVRQLFHIVDTRDWEELSEVFAEDAVYERPGYEPLKGLTRISHFYTHERIIASGRHAVDHVTAGHEAAACWGRFRGESNTGDLLDEQFADTYVLVDGKIAHRKTFFYRPAI
ncbi:nuclear transport factor 2 family protein [Kitasatospora sp. NPDC008050]|uniref:nuclear transport factor 2 family protein n=1 Tax=Kitasatospora sp. NPDC008050 TaxID=3364021 RepID=UPI0036F0D639